MFFNFWLLVHVITSSCWPTLAGKRHVLNGSQKKRDAEAWCCVQTRTLRNPGCTRPLWLKTWSPILPPSCFFFFCHLIGADALWRAFELTSKEKKEILWVPVFSCLLHSSYTHTHTCTHATCIAWLLTAISLTPFSFFFNPVVSVCFCVIGQGFTPQLHKPAKIDR